MSFVLLSRSQNYMIVCLKTCLLNDFRCKVLRNIFLLLLNVFLE